VQSQWLLQSLASAGQLPPLGDDGLVESGPPPPTLTTDEASVGRRHAHSRGFGEGQLAPMHALALHFDIYESRARADFDEEDDEDDLAADDGDEDVHGSGDGDDVADEAGETDFDDRLVAVRTEIPAFGSTNEFAGGLGDRDDASGKHPMQAARRSPGLIADEIDLPSRRRPSSSVAVHAEDGAEGEDMDENGYERDGEDDDDGQGDGDVVDDSDDRVDRAPSSNGRKSSSKLWSKRLALSKVVERKRLVTYVNGKAEYVEL
jgi:hypothetical protein